MGRAVMGFGIGLIVLGVLLVGVGALWSALGGRGWRGLPGDIVISRPGFTFVLPIATSLLLSLVVSLILWLGYRWRRQLEVSWNLRFEI